MLLEIVTGLLLASNATAPADAAAPKPEEKKICRRQLETGSLIKGKKFCYTAKQWQKIADANRDEIESRASSGSASGK